MKKLTKLIALIAVLSMVLMLAACLPETPPPTPPVGQTTGPAAQTAPPGPAVIPEAVEIDHGAVDHFARDPFRIGYICLTLTWPFTASIDASLATLGRIMNFEYQGFASNFDPDTYLNQVFVFADMGFDALVIGADDDAARRVLGIAHELDILLIGESTAFENDYGLCIWPSVVQDGYGNAYMIMEWLADNYVRFWGEIDYSTLGLLVLDHSGVAGITARTPGFVDAFRNRFPGASEDNIFVGDALPFGMFSVQVGFDITMPILANNPQITHWLIGGNVGDFGTGATRAVEALGMEDSVLVGTISPDAFLIEMQGGYTGNVFVAANAVSATEFAILMAEGLISILDGRYTPETLWPEFRDPGGVHPRRLVRGTMICRDTYQEFLEYDATRLQRIAEAQGVTLD